MTKATRRRFVQGSTALATAGGMAGILATGRRPPMRRARPCTGCAGTTSFRPPISCCARRCCPKAEKALGIKINFETVNANDLQPRITSAIQSGAGPDLIMLINNHPQLYADSVRRHVGPGRGDRQGGGRLLSACQSQLRTTARNGCRCLGPSSAP